MCSVRFSQCKRAPNTTLLCLYTLYMPYWLFTFKMFTRTWYAIYKIIYFHITSILCYIHSPKKEKRNVGNKKKLLRRNELGPKAKSNTGYLYARASGCVSIPSTRCATVIPIFIRKKWRTKCTQLQPESDGFTHRKTKFTKRTNNKIFNGSTCGRNDDRSPRTFTIYSFCVCHLIRPALFIC